jgi:hypothetical protein
MSTAKMLMPLALVYGVNKVIDTTDPANLPAIRIFFIACQFLSSLLWFLAKRIIDSKDEKQTLTFRPSDLVPPNPLGDALGVKVPEPANNEPETLTYAQYDTKVLRTAVNQLAMQTLIVGGIHYYTGSVLPLIMSSCMGLVNLYEAPLMQIHLLGKDPVSDEALKRPFRPKKSPFAAMAEEQKRLAKEAAEKDADGKDADGKDADGKDADGSADAAPLRKRKKKKARKD